MTLGERIRQIREARSLTQRQVAARIPIDDYYISRLENGHVNPTLLTLQKLADALQVQVRDFFPAAQPEFKDTRPKFDKGSKKVITLWNSGRGCSRGTRG